MSSRNDWRGRGERRDDRRRPARGESEDNNRPLPPEVYQRRRVAAVVVVLLLVALLIWAAVSCSGPKEESPAPAASSQTNSWQAPTAENAEESAKDKEKEKDTEDDDPKDGKDADKHDSENDAAKESEAKKSEDHKGSRGKDACELSDLKVTAQTDQSSYAEGQQPRFFMTVRNDTGADCEIDPDRSPLRFEVYDMANNARVWSDIDCNEPMLEGKTEVLDGDDRHFEAVWSRTTSGPEECAVRHPVPQGSYYLHAVLGDNPSAAQPFNITG